jgi:hypothetical protein
LNYQRRLIRRRLIYFAGDSFFGAAPLGPVVVFGIELALPWAPPDFVIPEPLPELIPVVVPLFIPERLFMLGAILLVAELLVGPVATPACP